VLVYFALQLVRRPVFGDGFRLSLTQAPRCAHSTSHTRDPDSPPLYPDTTHRLSMRLVWVALAYSWLLHRSVSTRRHPRWWPRGLGAERAKEAAAQLHHHGSPLRP